MHRWRYGDGIGAGEPLVHITSLHPQLGHKSSLVNLDGITARILSHPGHVDSISDSSPTFPILSECE